MVWSSSVTKPFLKPGTIMREIIPRMTKFIYTCAEVNNLIFGQKFISVLI